MAIVDRKEIDRRLRAKLGFWSGIWLSFRLAGRFILSFGPQNWDLSKIATAEKPLMPTGLKGRPSETRVIEDERKKQ